VLFSLVGTFTYVNFYLADPPFHLTPTALASIFTVYLIGAFITPIAGRLIDRVGYRRALVGAVTASGIGVCLTLAHSLIIVVAGLTLCATGVFASQSAASSYVGKAAGHARSSAAGLYVSLYYFGGCVGSIVPGLFWKHTGWPGCVALVLAVQTLTAIIAWTCWKD
jgi:MFS family permease